MTTSTVPTYDFVWQQGEDGEINMVYKSAGTPVNLTGYKLRMDVRADGNATPLFSFNSMDFTDGSLDSVGNADNEAALGSDGTIHIVVPRAATLGGGAMAGFIGVSLFYDIFLRDPSGLQKKIMKGTIIFEASQTKWL